MNVPSVRPARLLFRKATLLAKSLSSPLPVIHQARAMISLNGLSLPFLVPLCCQMNKGHPRANPPVGRIFLLLMFLANAFGFCTH